MGTLKAQIRESYFNPVLQLLPVLAFIVTNYLWGVKVGWWCSVGVTLVTVPVRVSMPLAIVTLEPGRASNACCPAVVHGTLPVTVVTALSLPLENVRPSPLPPGTVMCTVMGAEVHGVIETHTIGDVEVPPLVTVMRVTGHRLRRPGRSRSPTAGAWYR